MDDLRQILTAVNIHREFETAEGGLPVLKGVELSLDRGSMTAVTGPSGVGKSTLLHILGGLDQPTAGHVTVAGEPLQGKSEKQLAQFRNAKIGFVFQFHYLLEDFSALENVMIPLILAGAERSEAQSRAELLLEQVGLTSRRTHRPHELSGGEQQRTAVARALANGPEVVLADEPSGNLDTATGRKLHDLLFDLNRQKSTSFVVATHNRELAERCDRELRMADGRLVDA